MKTSIIRLFIGIGFVLILLAYLFDFWVWLLSFLDPKYGFDELIIIVGFLCIFGGVSVWIIETIISKLIKFLKK